MKLLLTLIITMVLSMGFLGCNSSTKADSTTRKSIPERIGDDAKSVGEGAANVVGAGLKLVGEAGEAVVDALLSKPFKQPVSKNDGNEDTDSDEH